MSLRLTSPPLHDPEPQPEPSLQGNLADRQSMQSVQSMQFKRRTCLPTELTKSWRIVKGVVRTVTWEEDGTIILLGYWRSSDIVGQLPSVTQPFQIECMTDVEAVRAPEQVLETKEWLLQSAQQTEALVRILHGDSIEKRLVRFLNWLAQRLGQQTPEGWLINFHLTHRDVADAISTTRVTTTRLLRKLEQERVITWQPKRYILLHRRTGHPKSKGIVA